MHGHTWIVRAFWPADGSDALIRQAQLREVLAELDHRILPPELSRAENIAGWICARIAAAAVDINRGPEGLGALWIA